MLWARLLAYVSGTVNQELLLRNEYLAAEKRILKAQIKGRLLRSEEEKATRMQNAGGDQSKRNAWQSSSYLESLRCGEPCGNICCITMKRGTIRAKAIGSCFLLRRRQEGTREQCCAGNDWAAC